MSMADKCEEYLDKAVEEEAKGNKDEAVRYFGLAAFAEARAKGIPNAREYAESCKKGL